MVQPLSFVPFEVKPESFGFNGSPALRGAGFESGGTVRYPAPHPGACRFDDFVLHSMDFTSYLQALYNLFDDYI